MKRLELRVVQASGFGVQDPKKARLKLKLAVPKTRL